MLYPVSYTHLTNPEVIVVLFIGGMLTFLFSALTMTAVGKAAKMCIRDSIEIIVKQMFKKVRIIDSGASLFLEDEVVEKRVVDLENARLKELGKPLIQYEPIIQGITKAAVNTGSFISAASFQETTKVLSNAAIEGKIDFLEGLKENVIIGKKIPDGTGFSAYKKIRDKKLSEEAVYKRQD